MTVSKKYHVLHHSGVKWLITGVAFEDFKELDSHGRARHTVTEFHVNAYQTDAEAARLSRALCAAMNDAHEAAQKVLEHNFLRAAHPK